MKTTDEQLRERFQSHAPALPEGFEGRHDRLLRRLTTGKEEPYMRKQRLTRLALVALLILTLTGAALAASQFGLFDLMRSTGHQPEEQGAKWLEPFTPLTFEHGKVRATLRELLSDGRGWYTSMDVVGTDDDYLIIPNFAEPDEPVTGAARLPDGAEPPKSFRQLAQESGRKLLRTGVYVEVAEEWEGFLEYYGTKPGEYTIVAGGYGDLPLEAFPAHFRILYEQAEADGTPMPDTREDLTFPLTVPAFGDRQEKTYVPADDAFPNLKEVTLTRTALTTYAEFVPTEEGWAGLDFELLDDQGTPYPPGFTMSGHAYRMDSLPDALRVRIIDYDKDGQQTEVSLLAKP